MTRRGFGRALAAAWLTAALWTPGSAAAFNGEPHGWSGMPWGTSAESAIKGNAEWRKRYKLNEVRKILETSDVIVEGSDELMGRRTGARWIFGAKGLHTVVLTWEDTRGEAYAAWKDLFAALEGAWGEPDKKGPRGEEMTWTGRWTKATVKRRMVPSGSGAEVRLEALPAAFEESPPAGGGAPPARRDNPSTPSPTPTNPGKAPDKAPDKKGDDDPFGGDDFLGVD